VNSKDKLNIFWVGAAILTGVYVVNTVGSGLISLIVIVAVIAWAMNKGHIR
jgi:hypothetical protein